MPEESLDFSPANVGELKRLVRDRHPNALKVFSDSRCIVAINQHVVHGDDAILKPGDEIAFYPPVTGG